MSLTMVGRSIFRGIVCLLAFTLSCAVWGVPTVSDLKVTSRAPWGIAIDYTVSGANEAEANVGPIVTATADGRTYTARHLSGAANGSNGAHRVYWDMLKDGITGKFANGVVRVLYDNALYWVIDLSGGVDADSYPVSFLNAEPQGGWTDEYKTTKLVLRRIEAGTFIMGGGTTPESHRVTISKPFHMGVFEVTQRQWELVMGTRPSVFTNSSCYAMRPVERVSYDMIRGSSVGTNWPASSAVDATSFLGKLRAKTGLDCFDLPTEAQWEYACRAGTTSLYNNGGDTDDDLKTLGRYYRNGGEGSTSSCTTANGTAAVGSYLPNTWGLYDMHGNVDEWCLDWGSSFSSLSYGADPEGSSSGSYRVLRGGSWSDYAGNCPSSYRGSFSPSGARNSFGFRLVRTLNNKTE